MVILIVHGCTCWSLRLYTAINWAYFVCWWMWFNGSPTKTVSFSHESILLPSYVYNMHQDTKLARLIAACKRSLNLNKSCFIYCIIIDECLFFYAFSLFFFFHFSCIFSPHLSYISHRILKNVCAFVFAFFAFDSRRLLGWICFRTETREKREKDWVYKTEIEQRKCRKRFCFNPFNLLH